MSFACVDAVGGAVLYMLFPKIGSGHMVGIEEEEDACRF